MRMSSEKCQERAKRLLTASTPGTFKTRLKTELFTFAYPT